MTPKVGSVFSADPPNGGVLFLRSDEADPPVTVIRDIRVKPGHEVAFEGLMSRLINEAIRQPGHLGATVVRPQVPGHAYRFIYKFDRRTRLEAWHGSGLRAQLVAPIADLIEWDRFDQFPGLETWFDLPAAPLATQPPKWKTTLMSWAAIYPLVLAGSYIMRAARFEAPPPVQVLVLTAAVVPIVAYVVAPWLGRRLHRWLYAGLERSR
ncbi:MAG: antibiotic biosynthesis monooxygenase [Planctomycetes bacterium]|nr:antibiotic biosynthesis monooxygenase [Planctomycetota bacterium]